MPPQSEACITTFISVVIPCHNCASTLGRSIDSVLQQTLPAFEIILVNDASADHTSEIISEFYKKDPKIIKTISLSVNGGAAHARNIGWNHATGDYIAFLDADDTWHPQKLRIQANFMQDNPSISISGHLIGEPGDEFAAVLPDCCNLTAYIIKRTSLLFSNPFSTPTVMVRREIGLRFPEHQRYSEDFCLWLNIAFADHILAHINHTLAFVHKPLWGHSGLSSNILGMEKGELSNFFSLFKRRKISAPLFILAISWSILKFIRRVIFVLFRKLVNV